MAKKKTIKKLTAEEIQKFKALLLAKRKEILGDVSTIENETLHKSRSDLSNMPIHMADVGSDNFEQEFSLGLLDGERKVIKEIDDALKRMEDGTYGICEGTGKPIERERMEAIPWAKYCVEYASQLEKGLTQKEGDLKNSVPGYPSDEEGADEDLEEPGEGPKDQTPE
jgi:RNA polymerase-binding protein DksA